MAVMISLPRDKRRLPAWSDQEDVANWTPAATNQAGSLRLSRGSEIVTAIQARQEVLIWTDTAVYGLQYLGAPEVWGAQILGDNITIASTNAAVYSGNIAYWMGTDKFYSYDGTVKTLPCSVRSYVFNDFNFSQYAQVVVHHVAVVLRYPSRTVEPPNLIKPLISTSNYLSILREVKVVKYIAAN